MKKLLTLAILSLLIHLPASAEETPAEKPTATAKGWCFGAQGGMPFGVSTFSSFGADKAGFGYSAGIYGGYRFNPVLSLEATAKWGEVNLSAKDCCIERHLWLGADGVRYNAPVLNMNGWGYDDIASSVFMQHYGLQLNVNVLGFFDRTEYSRWTLEVSPLLAAVGTRADVTAISDGAMAIDGNTRWHLGAGGNLQVGVQATKHLAIGLYSGLTYLTGDRMDGMPEFRHRNNFVWESGLKIGLAFGKKNRKEIPHQVRDDVSPRHAEQSQERHAELDSASPDEKHIEERTTVIEEIPDQVRNDVEGVHNDVEGDVPPRHPVFDAGSPTQISLPVIYFAFNSTTITDDELAKLQEIRKQMDANPEMKIIVNGWCDTKGSKAVNDRISLKRAETVKNWLVSNGIAAERITVKGNGSDFNEVDAAKARRAESVTIITE